MKTYSYYIFDFDGTLADSFQDLFHIFKTAFAAVNIPITFEQAVWLSRVSLVEGYTTLNGPMDPESISRYGKAIRDEVNNPESIKHTYLYPEVLPVLKALKDKGAVLAISTANSKEHVQAVLRNLNVDETLFDAIVGNDEVKKHKPDPEPVLKVLEDLSYQGDKSDVIYIGDALNDTLTGERAGVDTALVERNHEYITYPKTKIVTLNELLK